MKHYSQLEQFIIFMVFGIIVCPFLVFLSIGLCIKTLDIFSIKDIDVKFERHNTLERYEENFK